MPTMSCQNPWGRYQVRPHNNQHFLSEVQMQKQELLAAVVLSCAITTNTNAACYTVYKNEGVVYRSSVSPVDMSFPFSQTLPAKFGEGATMVYQEGFTFCPDIESTGSISSNQFRAPPQGRSTTNSIVTTAGASIRPPPIQIEERDSSVFPSTDYSGLAGYGSAHGAQGSIQTGPRGGKYYMNLNGNKTYVGSSGSKGSRGR